MQSGAHAERLELVLQARDVRRNLRPDVRVQPDRREALVLAVLRDHLGGNREERLGELLADDLSDALLVHRVQEGEEEADADGLDPGLLQSPHLLPRARLVERHENRAVAGNPLRHGQPVAPSDDRVALPRKILVVREVERLLVTRDVEDVAVALGRQHPDRRARVLDHDIRRDRRAVEDLVERGRVGAGLLRQLLHSLDRALRRVVGRRRELVDANHSSLVVDVDQVGERAADVDPDALHAPPPAVRTIFPKKSLLSISSIACAASSSGNVAATCGRRAPCAIRSKHVSTS